MELYKKFVKSEDKWTFTDFNKFSFHTLHQKFNQKETSSCLMRVKRRLLSM